MMEPLKQFICDECGEIIEIPEEGFVEWTREMVAGKLYTSGFRIVHNKFYSPYKQTRAHGCYKYNDHPGRSDTHLEHLLEMPQQYLLSFLDLGQFHDIDGNSCSIKDFREYADFARRLTVPYYEEARLYFDDAMSDGYSECNPYLIFKEDTLKRMIEEYAKD